LRKERKGHDRFERRRVGVGAAPKDANLPGLAMFGRVEREPRKHNGETSAFAYYVALSKRMSPRKPMEVDRAHWGVENKLHWPLDLVFDEDDARSRKNHAPQNLSVIRRMAIDISNAHPDQRSGARKMNLAAGSKEFFFEPFTHRR